MFKKRTWKRNPEATLHVRNPLHHDLPGAKHLIAGGPPAAAPLAPGLLMRPINDLLMLKIISLWPLESWAASWIPYLLSSCWCSPPISASKSPGWNSQSCTFGVCLLCSSSMFVASSAVRWDSVFLLKPHEFCHRCKLSLIRADVLAELQWLIIYGCAKNTVIRGL